MFKRHRRRTLIHDEHTMNDNLIEPMKLIRTSSKSRRATLISIPPTLINVSDQDIWCHFGVQPTVYLYNETTFQEVCYRSIEDIRPWSTDECLWIDVAGVSMNEICST
jgi:hypothetical protein